MKYFLPALGWAVFILTVSAIPGKVVGKLNWSDFLSFDKLAHGVVYMVLGYLLIRGYAKWRSNELKCRHWIYALVICMVYGALLESLQYACFKGRYFEFMDIIANIIGSICGIGLYKLLKIK